MKRLKAIALLGTAVTEQKKECRNPKKTPFNYAWTVKIADLEQ